jgi:hypothetical protein
MRLVQLLPIRVQVFLHPIQQPVLVNREGQFAGFLAEECNAAIF